MNGHLMMGRGPSSTQVELGSNSKTNISNEEQLLEEPRIEHIIDNVIVEPDQAV